jgi:mRNA interferase MazF
VKRGEIYVIDLGSGVGREVSGVCPVVVVSNDVNNLIPLFVAIVPAVDTADIRAGLGVVVPRADSGYSADISVLSNHSRTLDATRFTSAPVGTVPPKLMMKISFELQVLLDLQNIPPPPP